MQNKYKIPTTARAICLCLIRDYDRLVNLYHQRRNDILCLNSTSVAAMSESGGISDKTADKAIRLEKIEEGWAARVVEAIEQSKLQIGEQIMSDEQRELLTELIWESCLELREFCFEQRRGKLRYEKAHFYRMRSMFLKRIAEKLGLIF